MAKLRKQIQTDFAKLERQPYHTKNAIGRLITDTMVEISQGTKDCLGRRIKDKPTESQKAILDMVNAAFKELTIRQQRALNLYFGLNGSDSCTEREIAKKIGITQQSTHELKLRALKALRKKTKLNLVALKKISEK